jgi:hypothetical protein
MLAVQMVNRVSDIVLLKKPFGQNAESCEFFSQKNKI